MAAQTHDSDRAIAGSLVSIGWQLTLVVLAVDLIVNNGMPVLPKLILLGLVFIPAWERYRREKPANGDRLAQIEYFLSKVLRRPWKRRQPELVGAPYAPPPQYRAIGHVQESPNDPSDWEGDFDLDDYGAFEPDYSTRAASERRVEVVHTFAEPPRAPSRRQSELCRECDGDKKVYCPICEGSGKDYSDGTYDGRTCPNCGGAKKVPCRSCHATGRV
jgi:hypothetical protein